MGNKAVKKIKETKKVLTTHNEQETAIKIDENDSDSMKYVKGLFKIANNVKDSTKKIRILVNN